MRPIPPSDDLDFTLLDRFLAGECSPAEADLVRQQLRGTMPDSHYLLALRNAIQVPTALAAPRDDADALWARLARDTVDVERNTERVAPPVRLESMLPVEPSRLRLFRASWLRAAAVLALVVGGTVFALKEKEAAPAVHHAAIPNGAAREYVAARGERIEFRLPDGTRVLLAPESKLEVPADFSATDRLVALVGQAYFDVKHDDAKPFRVRAGHAVAHDLGTRFDVRAYPGDSAVRVIVTEGQVSLAANAPGAVGPVLGRGEMGQIDAGGTITTRRIDPADAIAWTRGELVFDDVSLHEAVQDLARWYRLDIQVVGMALREKRLTLALRAESASEAIAAVALLVGARYERRGNTVSFVAMPVPREVGR